METVAAIGIAGNIVQFIDFGCKLLSKAKAIYRDGAAVEHTDLRKVTEDLTALITKLSEDIRQASASNEPELQELCEGCLGVAKELQHALTKVNASSGQGRWKSIRAALKAVWGKEHITELKGRLDAYSMQLDRRVLVGLRSCIDVLALEQSAEFQKLDSTTRAIVDRMTSLEVTLEVNIRQKQDDNAAIMTSMQDFQDSDVKQHEQTRMKISGSLETQQKQTTTKHLEIRNDVSVARTDIVSSVEETVRANREEHEATRREMERLRHEAEEQVKQLKDEIQQLKLDIEQSIKQAVDSMGKTSPKEQKRLHERSNAKFTLWAAKEIILKKLLEFLSLFKFDMEDWGFTMDRKPWKVHSYSKLEPTKKSPNRRMPGFGPSDFTAEEFERGETIALADMSESDAGITPVYKHVDLHYPIAAGNVAMVHWCLENGADANSFLESSKKGPYAERDMYSKSPLQSTVEASTMTQVAKARIVRLLIGYGADPNWVDSDGETGLSYTIKSDQEAIAAALLEGNLVNLDTKDSSLRTPLSWASGLGQNKVVELLLARNQVDPDSKDSSLRTPLSWASEYGHHAVVKLLLASDRVHPDSKDRYGRTPLSYAAWLGKYTVVTLLLANNSVDPESIDHELRTPLSWASEGGNEAIVQLLLASNRVDPDSKDRRLRTPLSWASGQGHEAVLDKLLSSGRVDPDSKDGNIRTPLSYAVECPRLAQFTGRDDHTGHSRHWHQVLEEYEFVVSQLLGTGKVNPDTEDCYGQTPRSLAEASGYNTILGILHLRCPSERDQMLYPGITYAILP